MHIQELISYLDWFDAQVRVPNLASKYQALHQILQQNTRTNQVSQSFDAQRKALKESVINVEVQRLNKSQVAFAQDTGLLDLIGAKADSSIDDVLYKHSLDIATAAGKINEKHVKLNQILQHMNQVATGLRPYVESVESEYEEVLLHVRFQNNASINNVVELRQWSDAWFDIGRGVALAHGQAPEDVRIVGVSRGSIIYDLAVTYAIAHTVGGIILLVLRIAEKVQKIRKEAEVIRAMKLSNNKAEQELESEAERVEESGKEEVITELKKDNTYDGEQETALKKAISRMFDFVNGGGEVDMYVEEEEELEEQDESVQHQITDIQLAFQEIKKIEQSMLALESSD